MHKSRRKAPLSAVLWEIPLKGIAPAIISRLGVTSSGSENHAVSDTTNNYMTVTDTETGDYSIIICSDSEGLIVNEVPDADALEQC